MNETWAGIPRSPKQENQWPMVKCQTRVHFSRMHTARLLTVSRNAGGGGCLPRGCLSTEGESTQGGVCPGGGCLPMGVSTQGYVCPGVSTQGDVSA